MRRSSATSARRGTFWSSSVSAVSRLAVISGRAAFLAPEIGIVPWSGPPPLILIRSMLLSCSVRPGRTRLVVGFLTRIGRFREIGHVLGRLARLHLPSPDLGLAALQVLAQRDPEAFPPLPLALAHHTAPQGFQATERRPS